MEKLPYRNVTLETPVGVQTTGKAIDVEVCPFRIVSPHLTIFDAHRAYVA